MKVIIDLGDIHLMNLTEYRNRASKKTTKEEETDSLDKYSTKIQSQDCKKECL